MATTVDMRRQDTISETEKGEKQEQDLSEHKNAFVRQEKVASTKFSIICILASISFYASAKILIQVSGKVDQEKAAGPEKGYLHGHFATQQI